MLFFKSECERFKAHLGQARLLISLPPRGYGRDWVFHLQPSVYPTTALITRRHDFVPSEHLESEQLVLHRASCTDPLQFSVVIAPQFLIRFTQTAGCDRLQCPSCTDCC